MNIILLLTRNTDKTGNKHQTLQGSDHKQDTTTQVYQMDCPNDSGVLLTPCTFTFPSVLSHSCLFSKILQHQSAHHSVHIALGARSFSVASPKNLELSASSSVLLQLS